MVVSIRPLTSPAVSKIRNSTYLSDFHRLGGTAIYTPSHLEPCHSCVFQIFALLCFIWTVKAQPRADVSPASETLKGVCPAILKPVHFPEVLFSKNRLLAR